MVFPGRFWGILTHGTGNMDDRKKIAEWAKKNHYTLIIVLTPLPAGERFGYTISVRNVNLDRDIKLGTGEDMKRAKEQAEQYRQFFSAPIKIEGTERK